jgi:hypothetical protein
VRPDDGLSEEYVPALESAMFRCQDEGRWFSLPALADEALLIERAEEMSTRATA